MKLPVRQNSIPYPRNQSRRKALLCLGALLLFLRPGSLRAEEALQTLSLQLEVPGTPFRFEEIASLPWEKGPCRLFLSAHFLGPRTSLLFCLDTKRMLHAVSLLPGSEGSFSLPLPEGNFEAVITDIDEDLSEDLVLVPKDQSRSVFVLSHRKNEFQKIPLPPEIRQPNVFPRAVVLNFAGLSLDLLLNIPEKPSEAFHLRLLGDHFEIKNRIPLSENHAFFPVENVRVGEEAHSSLIREGGPLKLSISDQNHSRDIYLSPPNGFQTENLLSGDFDGDGASDILTYSGPIAGWSFTSLGSEARVSRAVGGLPRLNLQANSLLSIDRDGDGQSVVAFLEKRALRLFRLSSLPFSGASLWVEGKRLGTSDENGKARLVIPAKEKSLLVVKRSGGKEEEVLRREIYQLRPEGEKLRTLISSEALLPDGPRRCFGLSPNIFYQGSTLAYCPKGYYIFAVDDALKGEGRPGTPTTTVNCCPLPKGDALLEEAERVVKGECPPGFYARGIQTVFQTPPYPLELACAKLSPSKLHTSNSQAGKYFGPRASASTINPFTAPAGILLALGRSGPKSWDVDGCVGEPWGAMLSGVLGPRCEGTRFVQPLQPEGKQEKMFPDCLSTGNRFDPQDDCQ